MGYKISLLFVAVLLLSQVSWVQPVAGLEEWTPTVGASASWQTLEAWSYPQPPPPPARPPICITGDNEFTSANGVVGGDGSENNPFIIENWVIDASQADGIRIKNTTKHFVIRNVVVYNGSLYFNGIYPDNIVANSNQRLDNCYYGIYLENVVNGRVEGCVLENNFDGIFLENSTNNVFVGNSIRNSTRFGIYLYYSDNNTFINNTIQRSGFYDIVGAEFGLSILPKGALVPALGRISENNLFKANSYENAVAVPHVVNVKVSVTHDSATISWAIRCASTGEDFITAVVEYGLTPSYGYKYTVSDVYPSITLSGLSASTTYHFRIISTSRYNNTEITSDSVFTTSPPPPPPPPPPLTETAITIEPSTFNLASGDSLTLTATLKTSGGQPLKGKPSVGVLQQEIFHPQVELPTITDR
jgi:parallel beta-helix repeat protein